MVWTYPDHPYHKLHPWRSGCLYTALPTIIPLGNAGGEDVFPMVIHLVMYLFDSRQLLQQVIQPKGHTTVCPLDFWLPLFFSFFSFISFLFSVAQLFHCFCLSGITGSFDLCSLMLLLHAWRVREAFGPETQQVL